jgi:hypothetical protein
MSLPGPGGKVCGGERRWPETSGRHEHLEAARRPQSSLRSHDNSQWESYLSPELGALRREIQVVEPADRRALHRGIWSLTLLLGITPGLPRAPLTGIVWQVRADDPGGT